MSSDWLTYQILPNCEKCLRDTCPVKGIMDTKLVESGALVIKVEKCKICKHDEIDEIVEALRTED